MTGTGERTRSGRIVLALLLVALGWPTGSALAAVRADGARHDRRCSPAGIRALHGSSRVERQIRCLLNARRARARLAPLRYDRCLDRAAERHARDMVRRRYFAHTSRGGRTLTQRARAAGYLPRAGGWRLGENLAWGSGRSATARSTVRGWLHSPPHRRNVLAAGFRDVGVAVVRGAPLPRARMTGARGTTATIVVEFGARSGRACRSPRRPAARERRRAAARERRRAAARERRRPAARERRRAAARERRRAEEVRGVVAGRPFRAPARPGRPGARGAEAGAGLSRR